MKNRTLVFCTAALALTAALTACNASGSAREVVIEATEMSYSPKVIEVKPGEKIKFTVVNKGAVDHEFESEEIKFDELVIPPGKSRSVVVTMPTKAGEYEFFCDAEGHHADGMSGKIVVGQ